MENLWPLVPHFTRAEFDSKDKDGSGIGTGDLMSPYVVFMLAALRKLLGRPVVLNSAYRTVKHNRAIKGAIRSAHLEGLAVDVKTGNFLNSKDNWTKAQRLELIKLARLLGFTGVGIAATYIHLDVKPRTASWRYTPTGQIAVPLGEESKWL